MKVGLHTDIIDRSSAAQRYTSVARTESSDVFAYETHDGTGDESAA